MLVKRGKKKALFFLALLLSWITLFCPAQEIDSYKDSVELPALDEIEAVELLIAAPSLKSPASIAGHLFLLLRRKNDISGLSTVIGFVANSGEDESTGINPCLYSLRGLFGHYRSLVQKERLVTIITRNTIIEDRTVLRLQLKLSRTQMERLLAGIEEMERILPDKRYYFLNRNCTSLLLALLREVYRDGPRPVDIEFIDMPLHVAAKFFRAGLAEFVHPDYPSISQAAINGWLEIDRLPGQGKKTKPAKDLWRESFGQSVAYYRDNFSTIDRLDFYRKLFRSFGEKTAVNPDAEQKKALLEQGVLLLSFFQAADAIERFREYQEKKKSKDKKESIDAINPLITCLLDLNLQLRARLLTLDEESFTEAWAARENESSKTVRNKRDESAFLPGYSVVSLAPGLTANKGSFHFTYTFLRQQMGDQSLFAANRNSRLEFFKLSREFFPGVSSVRQTTLLQYTKVGKNPGFSSKSGIRPGFGFTFFARKSGLHPGINSHLDSWQTAFLLNLFEKDSFRHYLQVKAGFGLASVKLREAGKFNSAALLGGLEGKIQLDRRNRLELRAALQYNNYPARSGFSAETLEAEVEFNFITGRRTGAQVFCGWRMQGAVYRPPASESIEYKYKHFYLGLRFGLDSLINFFNLCN